MKLIYFTLLLLVSINSCTCKETGSYNLTNLERELIPYKEGSTIHFLHSNGFKFDLNVASRTNTIEKDHYENVGELSCSDYTVYEMDETILKLANPKIEFKLSVNSNLAKHNNGALKFMKITFNEQNIFHIYYDNLGFKNSDECVLMDSIMINNKMYCSVYKCTNLNADLQSTPIYPKYLYYNKDFGILKLQLSNNETYERNE